MKFTMPEALFVRVSIHFSTSVGRMTTLARSPSEDIEYRGEGSGFVGTTETDDIGQHDGEPGFTQRLFGGIHVGDNHAQYTEIGRIGQTESVHVDAFFPQDSGDVVDPTRFVFDENR